MSFSTRDGMKTMKDWRTYTGRFDTAHDRSRLLDTRKMLSHEGRENLERLENKLHDGLLESTPGLVIPDTSLQGHTKYLGVIRGSHGKLTLENVETCVLDHQTAWSRFHLPMNQQTRRGNTFLTYIVPDLPRGPDSDSLAPWVMQKIQVGHVKQDPGRPRKDTGRPNQEDLLWFYRIRRYEDCRDWDPTRQGDSFFVLWWNEFHDMVDVGGDFDFKHHITPRQWRNIEATDTQLWEAVLSAYGKEGEGESKASKIYQLELRRLLQSSE